MLMCAAGMTAMAGCGASDHVRSVSVDEFSKEISAPDVQLLDVRTPEEYAEGHIAGAVNVNVADADFLEQVEKTMDKKRTVYVYCRSGRRSLNAARILDSNGFSCVNMEGGIIDWEKQGKKIER